MTHPIISMESDALASRLPKKEVMARHAMAVAVIFTPLFLPYLAFEKSCGQKVGEFRSEPTTAPQEVGFTFSEGAVEWRGLDPKDTFEELLDMGFTTVRLATYMNQSTEDLLSELSTQISLARKHNVSVILAVGGKAPHYPEWYISPEEEHEEIQKAFAVIERFGNDPTVKYWQLSNEPFERSNGPEKDHVLRAIHAKMREYDKKIVVNHLIDLLFVDEDEFRKAAAYADIVGLNDFLQVSLLRDSCQDHVQRYQHFRRLADELGVELWITESQTQPWPAQIPFAPLTIPESLYDAFEPEEIPILYAMQNTYVRPHTILHWEADAAIEQAHNGDYRALYAITQTINLHKEG